MAATQRTREEDDILGPGRGRMAMALETMLKCLDSIIYAVGQMVIAAMKLKDAYSLEGKL